MPWEPNKRIVRALRRNIERMGPHERKKEIAILGVSDRKFRLEEIREIYESGEPREVAEFIEEFLISNTVDRLMSR